MNREECSERMKAARLVGPRNIEMVDAPIPSVRDGNCLVKIERWSICGSDIRNSYGVVLDEEEYPMQVGHPCHEAAGLVVESRSPEFQDGDRVIVLPTSDTMLVEYTEALPERMIPLPDQGAMDGWLMCQPSGTALYACQQMGTLLGKDAVVIGQGAIGLSFTALLSKSGAKTIVAVDLLDYRLDCSMRMGATHVVNAAREPVYDAAVDILGGGKPDIVVEAAGYSDTLNAALKLVKRFGIVLMFGIQQRSREHGFVVPMEYKDFRRSNARLIAAAAGHTNDVRGHIELMIELKRRGWWDPGELITHRMRFEDAQAAYDMYADHGGQVIKVVMEP